MIGCLGAMQLAEVWMLFFSNEEPLRIQSPSENGFMEAKYYAFRKWLDTPIIILRIWLHSQRKFAHAFFSKKLKFVMLLLGFLANLLDRKETNVIHMKFIYIYIVMWWFCRQDPCDFNMFFRFDKDCASKLKTHICPTPETGVSTYGSKPSDPRNSCGSLYFLFTSFVNPYNIYNGLGGFQTYFSSPVVQLGSQKPPTSVFFKCVFHRPAFGIHQQLQIFT